MVIGKVVCTANGNNVRVEETNNYCSKKIGKSKKKKKKMELGGSSAQEQGHRYANFFYPNPKKVLSEIAVFIK